MNTRNIGSLLRTNKSLYNIYYYVGSFILRLLGLFIPVKKNRILFVSFGGLKYDDSPFEIYNAMINDDRFTNFQFVWAFLNPEKFVIPKGSIVTVDTIRYFITALSSGIWITNSSVERGLSFRRKNGLYFNSWHGTPLKKMGSDLSFNNESFTSKASNNWDIQLAQSRYEAEIFSRVFNLSIDRLSVIGLPRNDKLTEVHESDNIQKKKLLGIPPEKKVILYAPTFREYLKDDKNNSSFSIPFSIPKWEEKLGRDYVLIIRAHYDIVKSLQIPTSSFVLDYSNYENLNDLMIASDILISDYSSIFFDFSILNRPMLCYAYDYDEYNSKRGLYFDIRKELGMLDVVSEDSLIDYILKLNVEKSIEITKRFRDKYVTHYGSATKESLQYIYNWYKNNEK